MGLVQVQCGAGEAAVGELAQGAGISASADSEVVGGCQGHL